MQIGWQNMSEQPNDLNTIAPGVLSRTAAKEVNCAALHRNARELQIGKRVNITVRPCWHNGTLYPDQNHVRRVPDDDVTLESVCTDVFSFFLVQIDYTNGPLDPNQLMTRGEFYIELLDIWETMRTRISPHLKELGEELDKVIEYTQNAYCAHELVDLDYLKIGEIPKNIEQ